MGILTVASKPQEVTLSSTVSTTVTYNYVELRIYLCFGIVLTSRYKRPHTVPFMFVSRIPYPHRYKQKKNIELQAGQTSARAPRHRCSTIYPKALLPFCTYNLSPSFYQLGYLIQSSRSYSQICLTLTSLELQSPCTKVSMRACTG